MSDGMPWATIPRPPEPNRCPYCGKDFVVESMTEYHIIANQCGLMPVSEETKNAS